MNQQPMPTYYPPHQHTTVTVQPPPQVVVVGGCPACRVSIHSFILSLCEFYTVKWVRSMYKIDVPCYFSLIHICKKDLCNATGIECFLLCN